MMKVIFAFLVIGLNSVALTGCTLTPVQTVDPESPYFAAFERIMSSHDDPEMRRSELRQISAPTEPTQAHKEAAIAYLTWWSDPARFAQEAESFVQNIEQRHYFQDPVPRQALAYIAARALGWNDERIKAVAIASVRSNVDQAFGYSNAAYDDKGTSYLVGYASTRMRFACSEYASGNVLSAIGQLYQARTDLFIEDQVSKPMTGAGEEAVIRNWCEQQLHTRGIHLNTLASSNRGGSNE